MPWEKSSFTAQISFVFDQQNWLAQELRILGWQGNYFIKCSSPSSLWKFSSYLTLFEQKKIPIQVLNFECVITTIYCCACAEVNNSPILAFVKTLFSEKLRTRVRLDDHEEFVSVRIPKHVSTHSLCEQAGGNRYASDKVLKLILNTRWHRLVVAALAYYSATHSALSLLSSAVALLAVQAKTKWVGSLEIYWIRSSFIRIFVIIFDNMPSNVAEIVLHKQSGSSNIKTRRHASAC